MKIGNIYTNQTPPYILTQDLGQLSSISGWKLLKNDGIDKVKLQNKIETQEFMWKISNKFRVKTTGKNKRILLW